MKVILGFIIAACILSSFAGNFIGRPWRGQMHRQESRNRGAGRQMDDGLNESGEKKSAPNPVRDLRYMKEIAQMLGMNVGDGVTEPDLTAEIRLRIQEAEDRAPRVKPLPEDVVSALKDVLGPKDYKAVLELNAAVKQMEGLRLLALPQKVKDKVK